MIIAIAGKKGAGKDTAADILVNDHGFRKISLADELKLMCSRIFEYPNEDNYDQGKKEKAWPTPVIINMTHINRLSKYLIGCGFEVTEEMFAELMRIGENTVIETPRHLLQFVGTDLIRNIVDPDVWIKLTQRALTDYEGFVVIPDARFKNERDAFREVGAKIALIKRPNISSEDSHVSENQLGDESEYDFIFYNDATISSLKRELHLWWNGKKRQL